MPPTPSWRRQQAGLADREVIPEAGEPKVMFCVDESGPLNLQPKSVGLSLAGAAADDGRSAATAGGMNGASDQL